MSQNIARNNRTRKPPIGQLLRMNAPYCWVRRCEWRYDRDLVRLYKATGIFVHLMWSLWRRAPTGPYPATPSFRVILTMLVSLNVERWTSRFSTILWRRSTIGARSSAHELNWSQGCHLVCFDTKFVSFQYSFQSRHFLHNTHYQNRTAKMWLKIANCIKHF